MGVPIYGCALVLLFDCFPGSDLSIQALCTEAALNAVQRRYPQIYKSNERLLLAPESIGVGLRDFMISVKSKPRLIHLLAQSLADTTAT